MSFATFTNLVTMIFCLAVLVQSVRMMRSLKTVRDGALTQMIEALDRSTTQARAVLSDLKGALADCAGNRRLIADSRDIAEELSVMIGIANASAERIVAASASASASASAANATRPPAAKRRARAKAEATIA